MSVEAGSDLALQVGWFAWRDVAGALALARDGGIALHVFRHDLRRFGLSANEPACHMLSADRAALIAFGGRIGLRPAWLEPPRPRRPDIWHFDAFGHVLARLLAAYPLPNPIAWPAAKTSTVNWPTW